MPKRYKLITSLAIPLIFIGLSFSPTFSQSNNRSGTVVGWGSDVLSGEKNKDFIDISAGGSHNLALRADGTVTAWGRNSRGQSTVPAGLNDVVAVAGGRTHSLALRSGGTVVAWGHNYDGQSTVPTGLNDVVAIAAGEYHSLALRSDGTVVAWGKNNNGQSTVPTGLNDVVAIAAGESHNLALSSGGTVTAWGHNNDGQSTVPTGLNNVIEVSAGIHHSIALRGDGTVVAWGADWAGQITVPNELNDVIEVSAGAYHSLALNSNGTVVAWGRDNFGQSTVPSELTDVVAVAGGGAFATSHSLVLRSNGAVATWGRNNRGQSMVPGELTDVVVVALGADHNLAVRSDGTVAAWGYKRYGKTTIPAGLDNVVAVAAGEHHSLALREDGTVNAWGADWEGQSTVPADLSDVKAVASGAYHNLALQSDGTVVAWGSDDDGQSTVPAGLNNVVAVATGEYHSLAVRSDGTVAAWGRDDNGQSTVPAGLNSVVAGTAGLHHSLALRSDGSVVTWGANDFGVNTVPDGLNNVVAVAAGLDHNLALRSDGTVVAWGISDESTIPPGLDNVVAIAAGRSQSFVLVEGNEDPDSPYLTNPISNRSITVGHSFELSIPSNTFDDPNGDNLTLTASLSNDSVLPSWLNFTDNGDGSGIFSGIPAEVGEFDIRVTATDPGGLSVSDNLILSVLSGSEPPEIISLTAPQNGPQLETISVPENGNSYIYYTMDGEAGPFYSDEEFTIGLLDNTQSISVDANSRFLEENLIQIEIPYDLIQQNDPTEFQVNDTFAVGETEFKLNDQEVVFNASPVDQTWTRTWSIFAGGSLGFTGCFKCVGGGVGDVVTVGVAKGSISGVGGMGFEVMANDEGDLYMKRWMERGIGIEVEVPVIEDWNNNYVNASLEGDLLVKGMTGQTVGFNHLNLDESTKQLAQTGFMLETLLLGRISMSPFMSPLLKATTATLNKLGGIKSFFDPAILSKRNGIGLEGSISAGVDANIGPVRINAIEKSANFVANANWHDYPNSSYSELMNRNKYGQPVTKILTNEIDSGFSLNYANKFDISSLSWDFKFGLSGASLLNDGTGSEFEIAGYRNSDDEIVKLDFTYSNGADSGIFVSDPFIFNSSQISITSNYSSFVANNETIFDGIVVEGVPIPFGRSVMDEFQEFMNTIKDNIDPEKPLYIHNSEKRGIGYDLGFSKEIGAAFVVGGGLKIGMDLVLYEELEYPKSYVELYDGGGNFIINSSEYSQSMEGQKLREILNELFLGVLPSVEEVWGDFVNLVRKKVDSLTEYSIEIKDSASEAIGNLKGSVSQGGEFVINYFSPRSNRVVQKAFESPEVQNMYSSPNVLYSPVGKAAQMAPDKLSEAGSEVIIISQVSDLAFIPEGESESIDELDSSVTLDLEIKESDLVENDFDLSDIDRVKIYRYDLETNSWVRLDGELDEETLATDIQKMGSYALGIEINRSNDENSPEIYDSGFLDETEEYSNGEIYANLRDDRYGSGIDFSQTFMLLNGDTLSYTLQPSEERIFYQLSEEDNLTGDTEDVKIIATDLNGNQTETTFTFELVGTNNEDDNESPDTFELMDNYPNPFNPQTVIPFSVPEAVEVQIRIYDVLGRYVATLLDERVQAGYHEVVWDSGIGSGQELSTGVYFYQIQAGDFNQVKKMMYLK